MNGRTFFLLIAIKIIISDAVAIDGRHEPTQHGSECSTATAQATIRCLTPYYAYFGFDVAKMPPFDPPVRGAIDEVWGSGREGVATICRNIRKLTACLQKIPDFHTCQNDAGYETMLHLYGEDVEGYHRDHVTRRYQCDHENAINVVLGPTQNGSHCSTATAQATIRCLAPYYAFFGFDIDKMPPFDPPVSGAIDTLWGSGRDGVATICRNIRKLTACLQKIPDFHTCQNNAGYEAMLHLHKENAEGYHIDHVTRRFQCDHENVIFENYECLLRADRDIPSLIYCNEKMEVDVIYEHIEFCVALNECTDCITQIYVDACGSSIRNFACNLKRRTHKLMWPRCRHSLPPCLEEAAIEPITMPRMISELPGKIFDFYRRIIRLKFP